MNNFFKLGFWFDMDPGPLSPVFLKLLYALAAIFLMAAIAAKVFSKIDANRLTRPIWKRAYFLFLTDLIIGLFVIFFHAQSILFFTARFWFPVWALVNALWMYFIVRAIIAIPAKKKVLEKEMEFRKYLPR